MGLGQQIPWPTGAYFAIPLSSGYGFARVISQGLIGVYDLRIDHLVDPARLDEAPVLFFCLVHGEMLVTGDWPVIGVAPLEARFNEPIKFAGFSRTPGRAAISVVNRREYIPVAEEAELAGLEWARSYQRHMVEQRIENHFAGRPCPIKQASAYDPELLRERLRTTGINIFEQDDAATWLQELAESGQLEAIVAALRGAMTEGSDLQVTEAAVAVAAAELIAAAKGHPAANLPREIKRWIVRRRKGIVGLAAENLAEQALQRVRQDSELLEQWAEAGMRDEFTKVLDDLTTRLQ